MRTSSTRTAATRCATALGAILGALAPAGAIAANVLYYGGPVISDTEIVMVNWSHNVPDPVKIQLPTFYADVVQSNYWTTMLQYSTAGLNGQDGMPGSNQQIGMGSFVGAYTITPAVCAGTSACTVTTTQIETELVMQIDAHNLPAASVDAQGYPNTLYMVHFAPNVTINAGAHGTSCVQFCATSDNFDYGALKLSVVLLPDMLAPGCNTGCSSGGNYLDNATSVASGELGGLTTGPRTATAATYAPPLAWYAQSGGRINDKCNGQQVVIHVNGHAHVVQKLWSNATQTCVSSTSKHVVVPSGGPNGTVSPTLPQAVDPNGTVSFTVTPDPTFGAVMTGTCGGALVGATYTTDPVTADCTVVASFVVDALFSSGFEDP